MNIGFFIKTLKNYDAHIAPIIENAPSQDFNFFIFHINKIYSPEFDNKSIKCKSIDLTTHLNIKKILNSYKLDFMIFFSPGHIYAIFLINICKQLSITPIYFQHGLSLDFSSFDPKSLSQDKSIGRKFFSFKKYSFFYSSIGINLLFVKKRLTVLKHLLTKSSYFLTYLFRKDSMHKLPKYGLEDIHCNYAFVYGNNDKNYLVESMKMNPRRIVVSGYPFLNPTKKRTSTEEINRILYLTPAFRADGVLPISVDEEREFYLALYEQVKMADCELDIKVHPRDDLELIKSYFEGIDTVNIYSNENLADLTLATSVVISDFSTALFYAIKYYKPIIILNSEYFESYPFDYTKYGIGIKSDLDNLRHAVKKALDSNPEKDNSYQKFITNFLSDCTDSDAYQRFYSTIEKIETKKHK
jgi:hypothetical protein